MEEIIQHYHNAAKHHEEEARYLRETVDNDKAGNYVKVLECTIKPHGNHHQANEEQGEIFNHYELITKF